MSTGSQPTLNPTLALDPTAYYSVGTAVRIRNTRLPRTFLLLFFVLFSQCVLYRFILLLFFQLESLLRALLCGHAHARVKITLCPTRRGACHKNVCENWVESQVIGWEGRKGRGGDKCSEI